MYKRQRLCRSEIEFALAREKDCGALMSRMEAGVLPLRVTHNDTKLNNILFDAESGKGLCIIDLDTIMPGLAANDFGDSIRFGASTAEEDERDLDTVSYTHLLSLCRKFQIILLQRNYIRHICPICQKRKSASLLR